MVITCKNHKNEFVNLLEGLGSLDDKNLLILEFLFQNSNKDDYMIKFIPRSCKICSPCSLNTLVRIHHKKKREEKFTCARKMIL